VAREADTTAFSSEPEPRPGAELKPGPETSVDDREEIESVAKGFLSATRGQDRETAETFLTPKARTGFAKFTKSDRHAGLLLGAIYRLGEPSVTGDTAVVAATLREAGKEQAIRIKLRRVARRWGVFAVVARFVPDDPKSEIVVDFEDPDSAFEQVFGRRPADLAKAMERDFQDQRDQAAKDSAAGKPGRDELAVEGLDSISRTQFEASWKIDLEVKDRPAGEVLRELAKAADLSLETTPIQDRALANPVALALRRISRHQAIEEVARAVGLSAVYAEFPVSPESSPGTPSVQTTLRFRPQGGARPVAFAGPFRIELAEVREDVPYATGMIALRVIGMGLSPTVLNELQKQQPHGLKRVEAVDAREHSLVDDGSTAPGMQSMSMRHAQVFDRMTWVPLKGLLRQVATMTIVRGTVIAPLPARVETVRFDKLLAGETRRVGDMQITLKAIDDRRSNGFLLTLEGSPVASRDPRRQSWIGIDRMRFVGHDAQNQPLRTISESGFSMGNASWTTHLQVAGSSTSLVVKAITEEQEVPYDFRFENIPLPAHGSMPERIEPAEFAGHEAPVTVEFVSLGGKAPFQTAQLRVTNHSNKDIRMLGLKLNYLAADGQRLGGWDNLDEHGAMSSARRGGAAKAVLVAKSSKSVIEVNAPFLKDGTQTIAVTVCTVGFADAESWSAPVQAKP
jgi:hypothetical protein